MTPNKVSLKSVHDRRSFLCFEVVLLFKGHSQSVTGVVRVHTCDRYNVHVCTHLISYSERLTGLMKQVSSLYAATCGRINDRSTDQSLACRTLPKEVYNKDVFTDPPCSRAHVHVALQ